MTDIIQELRGLIAEATPGEWALGVRSNQRAIAGGAGEWLALLPNGHREGFGLTSDSEIRANAALIAAAINHLPALLDRLEAAERGWQPIETAPRDGTVVDLFGLLRWYQDNRSYPPSRPHRAVNCFWDAGRWCGACDHDFLPTHWRPLPDAPAIREVKP